MTVFDTSALARPLFTDADFTATKWDSAFEKAAFANALCRFMSDRLQGIPVHAKAVSASCSLIWAHRAL